MDKSAVLPPVQVATSQREQQLLVASRKNHWAELGEIGKELAMALALALTLTPTSQVDADREHEDRCHQCSPKVAETTTRFRKLR
jgi:hypothetical protein